MSVFEENSGGNTLLLFVRNAELGKVKTRLAKSIGNEKAMEVYQKLLEYTRDIALEVNCFRTVYYSDYANYGDIFQNEYFLKDEQPTGDLGERLHMAFQENFDEGFENVVCIGSDCLELTSDHIKRAFRKLGEHEIVIGPAKDGGYYLIGMNSFYPELFQSKPWSSENLFLDTLLEIKNLGLSYFVLPTLNDIDELNDVREADKRLLGL